MLRTPPRPRWTTVDDTFVLGACPRRLFGYISRTPDGEWAAFDDASRVRGTFAALDEAQHALWSAHRLSHATECASPARARRR